MAVSERSLSVGEQLPLLAEGIKSYNTGASTHQDLKRQSWVHSVCHKWFCVVALIATSMLLISIDTKLMPLIRKEDLPPSSANQISVLKETAKRSLKFLNAYHPMTPSIGKDKYHTGHVHCETTVVLVRHCDDHGKYAKDDEESGDKHCSHMGYERTKFLSTLFGSRWPHPSFLYALLPPQPQGTNYRQIETLLPLAQQEDLTIHVVGKPSDVSDSIFAKMRSTPDEMCGKISVVAWKHAYIPEVAANLGCGPHQGCRDTYPDEDFDQVWELKFVYHPEEPKNKVMKLFQSHSLLLSDDYGLLQVAARNDSMTSSEDDFDNDEDEEEDNVGGWTVYGSISNQEFDPLALDQVLMMKHGVRRRT